MILKGLKINHKTTFRVNTLKANIKFVRDSLDKNGIEYTILSEEKGIFILDNYYVKNGFDQKTNVKLEDLDIYKDGLIYVQSISSMLPVYVLDPKPTENILDMCAAPGGKTTLIQSYANNKAYVTAVELHKDRYERMNYNIKNQGANVYTLNMSSFDLDDNLKFDKILLDAPCSGSGILDINNTNYERYFTDILIDKCERTQKKLIKKSYKLLKQGGIVVYSTCSLLNAENEEIVYFASQNGFEVQNISRDIFGDSFFKYIDDRYCTNDNGLIKIIPNELYEGFFIACLKKK